MRLNQPHRLDRRAFLRDGSLILAAAGMGTAAPDQLRADELPAKDSMRVGMITDLHYADKPPAGTRHYRESLPKVAEAIKQFEKEKPAFIVELGDLIDAADSVETELSYLKRIHKELSTTTIPRHYVLGNHCVDMLTKEEFLGAVGQQRSYFSADAGAIHFVVLDACFRGDDKPYGRKNSKWNDANIPAAELDWLKLDLASTDRKVIVFCHQRLDVSNDYGVKNAPDVRKVIEASGKVLAVFQGHSHKNDYRDIAGVHYCTLVAMVEGSGAENSGYSIMQVKPNGTIVVAGFRKQKSFEWSVKPG